MRLSLQNAFLKYKALVKRVYARKMGTEQILDASDEGKFWIGRSVSVAPDAKIGAWSYIQSYSYVGHGVVIGRYCSIARGVEISPVHHDYNLISNHEFLMHRNRFANEPKYVSSRPQTRRYKYKKPAIIGDDVWIGAKACVLRGVHVHTGAVVGANAVVTRHVPPYAIVAGVPARVIGYRFQAETIDALLASRWWLLDPVDLDDFDLDDPTQAAKQIAEKLKSEGRI